MPLLRQTIRSSGSALFLIAGFAEEKQKDNRENARNRQVCPPGSARRSDAVGFTDTSLDPEKMKTGFFMIGTSFYPTEPEIVS